MVIRAVRQRPAQCPQMASLCQSGKMLANLNPRRVRVDRAELAADGIRRLGLHVEAVVLRQAPREKDVDHASRGRRGGGACGCFPQRLEMIHPEPQEAERACLKERAAADGGMLRPRQGSVQSTVRRGETGGVQGKSDQEQLMRFPEQSQSSRRRHATDVSANFQPEGDRAEPLTRLSCAAAKDGTTVVSPDCGLLHSVVS